jgi:branched-chain amino acid transport system ATP-binding protein
MDGAGALLELKGVDLRFGGLAAVQDVSMQVDEGSITALIGPNGAGKTTVFNIVSGVYKPLRGEIFFQDRPIAGLKPFQVKRCGIARTYQQINLFSNMTVLGNALVGGHTFARSGLFASILRLRRERKDEELLLARIREELEFVQLAERSELPAKNLPYGEQRRLEIARALASKPRLILLDEPAAGMNTKEKNDLMQIIRGVRDRGITVLLVEHDMRVVMGLADVVHVMNFGKMIAAGRPEGIQKNQAVIEAYLGFD